MSQKSSSAIAVVGIDIGKNSFHVVGHNRCGAQSSSGRNGRVARSRRDLPTCRHA